MIRWDFEISMVLWAVSLASIVIGPVALILVAATTVNLWHQRQTMFSAGMVFEQRVLNALSSKLTDYESRMKLVEAGVSDVKEAQVRIAGQFRGRQLP